LFTIVSHERETRWTRLGFGRLRRDLFSYDAKPILDGHPLWTVFERVVLGEIGDCRRITLSIYFFGTVRTVSLADAVHKACAGRALSWRGSELLDLLV
jgi:hypothetical protein